MQGGFERGDFGEGGVEGLEDVVVWARVGEGRGRRLVIVAGGDVTFTWWLGHVGVGFGFGFDLVHGVDLLG